MAVRLQDDSQEMLEHLARQVREGNAQAMDALLQACRTRLLHYFRTRCRTADDCEDLIQETLLRVCQALPRTDLDAPFEHWLYRIASNCIITYYSRAYRQREVPFTQLSDTENVLELQQESFEASLLERIADEQIHAMLVQVMKEVCSDAERRVILMHAQHETLETIAQILQMNYATVRTHLMRGRAKVLAFLIQHRPDLLGGAAAIQAAIAALEHDGGALTEAEQRALQSPNPNQTDLRHAALKLAKYLRLE